MSGLPNHIEIKGEDGGPWRVRIRAGLTHQEYDCDTLTASLATVARVMGKPTVWCERFLEALRMTAGDVQRAAEFTGVSRCTVYRHRNRSPRFRDAIQQVRDQMNRAA